MIVTNVAPLSPVQLWFFGHMNQEGMNHWNQAQLVDIHDHVNGEAIQTIARLLATHHDMLRAR